jgi:hypothetical protein
LRIDKAGILWYNIITVKELIKMKVYVLLDTVSSEVVGVYSNEYGAINGIRYVLRNSKEFLEDFEKDYKLYGKSCITMYGFEITEETVNKNL